MKLLLSLYLSRTLATTAISVGHAARYDTADTEVYIRVSSGAKVYQVPKNCRGLDASTHTIKKVIVKEAINDYNRRACKVCY
jgi:hypothetical protein